MKKKGLLGPQLEEEIVELVKETLKKENREITKAELKQLIKEVMPNIEAMIAKNVKQHLRTIAVDLLDKTSGD